MNKKVSADCKVIIDSTLVVKRSCFLNVETVIEAPKNDINLKQKLNALEKIIDWGLRIERLYRVFEWLQKWLQNCRLRPRVARRCVIASEAKQSLLLAEREIASGLRPSQ